VGDLLVSVVLWWGAAVGILVCLIAVVRPMKRLFLPTRRRAAIVMASLVALIVAIAVFPIGMTTIASPVSRIDEVAPAYHFAEKHQRHVDAPPERVYAAMKATTASEIRLFQTFTWLRRFGQPLPESILNAPENMPILDVATRGGFVLLADEPPRELVVASVVAAPRSARGRGPLTPELYRVIQAPGFVKAAMNFRIEPDGSGSRITTETRVTGTDAAAIRRFTPYWRTILPGSWILRVTWLDAIARRAEGNERRTKN
jgi:hypothetical protein